MTSRDDARDPATGIGRRTLLIGAVGVAAAAGTAGWVASRPDAAPVPGAPDVGQPTAELDARELDVPDPAAPAFFGRFALGGAVEVERYDSVREMAQSATAVVVARVADVVATRTIVGEGTDRVGMVGLVLRPTVIRGRVASTYGRRLVVEFVGGSEPVEQTVADLRRSVPRAAAVWFLRAKAEGTERRLARLRQLGQTPSAAERRIMAADRRYFRLVSSQGFFIQGSDHVQNPMADRDPGEPDPLRVTGRVERLSSLVAQVKATR